MQPKNKPPLTKSTTMSMRTLWLTVAAVVASLCLAYLWPAIRTTEHSPLSGGIFVPSTNEVSEVPLDTTARDQHTVDPDMPRYLAIPKLALQSRILQMNEKDGRVDAPRSIYDVGWYGKSARPGEKGVTFLDGHVSGPSKPGVFKRLGELVPGDTIEIEKGDGTHLLYTVSDTRLVAEGAIDMEQLLGNEHEAGEQLILMTCGGRFNYQLGHYEKRVIVRAIR